MDLHDQHLRDPQPVLENRGLTPTFQTTSVLSAEEGLGFLNLINYYKMSRKENSREMCCFREVTQGGSICEHGSNTLCSEM